ncbi:MAG: DUF86 domain-containing protein [Bacteroidaceae bacterium]|nr:DUF86 domain-containing protein [Bacteroidaceae bacterium]MBR1667101.1 DUF86 domain-containing protein [Bacteroidaceae bacterium]
MRERTKDPKRLADILQAIDNIVKYIGDTSMEEFIADGMCYHAVVYNLMIIGEAANMLTFDFREEHPKTPWKEITGMRNFLVHDYHHVEEDIVWKAIQEDLPPLREQVIEYLKSSQ